MQSAIRHLLVTDFRSHARAELACGGRTIYLHGPNGAGKTNLLEAISLLSPGRGLRGAAIAELGRRGPDEAHGRAWAVSVLVGEDDDAVRVGTGVEAPGAARRLVRVDGELESRKTAKIRAGQRVECQGVRVLVTAPTPPA